MMIHCFGFSEERARALRSIVGPEFDLYFCEHPRDLSDGYFTSFECGGPEVVVYDVSSQSEAAWSVIFDPPIGGRRIRCPIVGYVDESLAGSADLDRLSYLSDLILAPPRAHEFRIRMDAAVRAPVRHLRFGLDQLKRFGVGLTFTECRILAEFLSAPRLRVSREELMRAIWIGLAVNPKTLDVHLFNLRKKIAGAGYRIEFSRRDGSWVLSAAEEPKEPRRASGEGGVGGEGREDAVRR